MDDRPEIKDYLPNGESTLAEIIKYEEMCPELVDYIDALEDYINDLEGIVNHHKNRIYTK